jgi:hypothetical protein
MIELTPEQQALAQFIASIQGGVVYNGRPDRHTEPLQAVSAADLYQMPDDAGEPLLGPLVRRGERLLLGAATGEGKTTFVMQMLGAVLEKRSFLDWQGVGGRVLVIDAEQTRSDIKRQLEENGLTDSTDLEFIHVPDGLMLQKAQSEQEQLEAIIREGGFDMVVADPLYKLTLGANLNNQAEAVALMSLLDRLRSTYHFNLTIPVHCRKPPPKAPFTINEIHGAGAWTWGAETVLGLQLINDGFSRLHFFKHRAGKSSGLPVRGWWGLSYNQQIGFAKTSESSKKGSEVADTRAEIIAVLRTAGNAGASMDALAGEVGRNRSSISRLVNDMVANGHIGERKHGRIKIFFLPGEEPDDQTLELWEKQAAG